MARLFPDITKDRVIFASKAEEHFYDVCKSSLGAAWRVFYSCSLSSIEKDQGLQDNEIDFVLYHPRFGLVVIEVKGGRIRYEANGNNFFSVNRHGKSFSIKNPFQQALVWRSRFVRMLKDKGLKVPVSHAVCFPNVFEHDFPASASVEPEIIIGKERLTSLEQTLKQIVNKSHPERFLKFTDCGNEVEKILIGHDFCTRLYIRDYIDTHDFRVKDVETLHETFITPVANAKRLGIEGEAGTGKTVLAISLAKYFRNQSKKVMLLSSNNLLNLFLQYEVGAGVDIKTYAEIAKDFGVNLLAAPEDFKGTLDDWVQFEAPDRLMKAVEAGQKERYDIIICDEAQDVQPFWWDVIEKLVKDKEEKDSRLYIFFDRSQGVFGSGGGDKHFIPEDVLPVDAPYFTLVNNYRTTREIGTFARQFRTGKQIIESHSSRLGYLPELVLYKDEADAKNKMTLLLKKLVRDEGLKGKEITLLSARKPQAEPSVIAGLDKLGDVPLHYLSGQDAKTWKDGQSIDETKVNVSIISAFKGLETKVGILFNVSEYHMPLTNPIMASLIYVACTRAKHMLYVFIQQDDHQKRTTFEQALKAVSASGGLVLNTGDSDYEYEGIVAHYNPERIGWLTVNDSNVPYGKLMFFPSDVARSGIKEIRVGDKMRFRLRIENDQTIAADLRSSAVAEQETVTSLAPVIKIS